jgi:hypothetical protein
MLTKFDTIEDKVGAAVSMVYVTGQPVVLVGVGQNLYRPQDAQLSSFCSATSQDRLAVYCHLRISFQASPARALSACAETVPLPADSGRVRGLI